MEEFKNVISVLHKDESIPHTQVWLNETVHDYANEQLSVFKDRNNLLALSAGDPTKPDKNWPIKKFVELINKHRSDFSGFVFLGGTTETENTISLISQIDMLYIDITGRNSLLESRQYWNYRVYMLVPIRTVAYCRRGANADHQFFWPHESAILNE